MNGAAIKFIQFFRDAFSFALSVNFFPKFRFPEGNSFCFDNSFLLFAYPRIKNGRWSLGWTFNRTTIIYRRFLLRAQFPFRCQVNTKFSLWRNLFKTFFAKKKKTKLNEPYLKFNFLNRSKFGTNWALWINNQCFSPEKTTENFKSPASHYSLRMSSREKTSDIEMRRQE